MTPTNNHNSGEPAGTEELLELAIIDALGLLDDEDRARFDEGFANAPATLRELIRAEQARLAECDFLPDVDAPGTLREKTLARVRAEIEKARGQAAPASAVRAIAHEPSPRPPRLQRARRVSPAWRVTSVAMAVAVVVLGVLHVQLRGEFNHVREREHLSALIDTVGTENIEVTLFDLSTTRIQFQAVADVGRAQAVLLHNGDRNHARLYLANFSTQTDYKLVVLDENDKPTGEIASFKADGLFSGVTVKLNQAGPMRLAIMTDEASPRVLFVADVRIA